MSSDYVKTVSRDHPPEIEFFDWVLNNDEDRIRARIEREGITPQRFAHDCLAVADDAAAYGCDFGDVRRLRRWARNLLEQLDHV